MYISVVSLLCLGLVFGSCQARDHRQFLRDLQTDLRDELAIEEFEDFIEELQKPGSCSNANNTCSCCVKLPVQQHMKVCGIASFDGDKCVDFNVTLNGGVIMMANITGPNVPPICKNVQPSYDACVVFDKVTIDLKGHKFTGCANIQIKQGGAVMKTFKLGCFELPPKQKYRWLENWIIRMP